LRLQCQHAIHAFRFRGRRAEAGVTLLNAALQRNRDSGAPLVTRGTPARSDRNHQRSLGRRDTTTETRPHFRLTPRVQHVHHPTHPSSKSSRRFSRIPRLAYGKNRYQSHQEHPSEFGTPSYLRLFPVYLFAYRRRSRVGLESVLLQVTLCS